MIATIMFSELKEYSFLHSGYQISEAVVAAIKNDIPGNFDYKETRFMGV